MEISQVLDLIPLKDRFDLLERSFELAPSMGHILEFGVYKGASLKFLAELSKGAPLTGFDSFCGLPEDWKRNENSTYKKGHFNLRGHLPEMPEHVELVSGFFEDTLSIWMSKQFIHVVSFLHVDCDLYSGAKHVLTQLDGWISPGTIIVFDELGNFHDGVYKEWESGEWLALNEWLTEYGRKVTPIFRTTTHQAAFIVDV